METNLFLEIYLEIATVVLNAASWVLDRYIGALDWIDAKLCKWRATHIIHIGPLRVKFHRDYLYVYTLQRSLWMIEFRKKDTPQ